MSKIRMIRKVLSSKPTLEGAGVHLKRVFGYHQVPLLDPFLLLDDFHIEDPEKYLPGFPWHPHRGIETITYVLHGIVEHGDSLGNSGVIRAGDVQWMTAGCGIIHQEMPKDEEGPLLWGFQLWANLPARQKMIPPRYRDLKSEDIPVIERTDGTIVKVISGKVGEVEGPVHDIVIEPEFLDVTVSAGCNFIRSFNPVHTVFAYVIEGSGIFSPSQDTFTYELYGKNYFDIQHGNKIGEGNLILFAEGDQISVEAGEEDLRFLLISGKPLREPIAWYGPIVMNTQKEIRQAFREYREGTFLRDS